MTIFDWKNNVEILNNLPEILNVLKNHLIVVWTDTDIKTRDRMNKDYDTMDREEFEKEWGRKTYDFRKSSNRTITKSAIRAAENFVIGIVNRIQELGGKILDCSKLMIEDCSINGFVKCEKATIKIISRMFVGSSRMHHNVKIELVDPPKQEEKHDLNYWLNALDVAMENEDFNLLKRAKSAIKELMENTSSKPKRKYYVMTPI